MPPGDEQARRVAADSSSAVPREDVAFARSQPSDRASSGYAADEAATEVAEGGRLVAVRPDEVALEDLGAAEISGRQTSADDVALVGAGSTDDGRGVAPEKTPIPLEIV